MTQKFTLHTHTTGFDGRNSVQEMVDTARNCGFNTIGISNHFIVYDGIKQTAMYPYADHGGYANIYSESFDEAIAKFVPHYEEIEKVKSQNPDMTILRGMEVDFFNTDEWRAGFSDAMAKLKPDYVIGSAHFIEYNGNLLNSHDWLKADNKTRDILLSLYWKNIANAGASKLFTWLAHLDLPKKVGLGMEPKWAEYESRAIETIAKSNGMIEINTGFYKPHCYEPYPSIRILEMAKENGVPVLLSDDAHASNQIGRHFSEAQKLITELNLKRYQR